LIAGQKVVAVVVGRGGSKGLLGKNLATLGGKPLVAWSVAAAARARCVDVVTVSSDDPDILNAARLAGCERTIRRPDALATDTASVHDAVIHALDELEWTDGFVVLLQATSPLRSAADVDACIEACVEADAPSAVTVSAVSKPPQWMFRLDAARKLERLIADDGAYRRQDTEPLYALNGAVYVARTEWYRRFRNFVDDRTVATIMPAERSVDVDTEMDLILARALVA
jgi:CMP-N,N'-diacetyllegionaminic acid synthase